jgi:hypothetical protein
MYAMQRIVIGTVLLASIAGATTYPVAEPPLRWQAGDLGLHYGSSPTSISTTDCQKDIRNGKKGYQYVLMLKAEQLNWEFVPEVMNAYYLYPSCGHPNLTAMHDTIDKFGINYVLRPLASGGTYTWLSPTYLCYIPHNNLLAPLRACILSQPAANAAIGLPGNLPVLLNLRIQGGQVVVGDTSYVPTTGAPNPYPNTAAGQLTAKAGTYDTLTFNNPGHDQCSLLQAAETAHMQQGMAVLNHDYALADQLAAQVVSTAHDFEASARTAEEEQLFTLIFTGLINPTLRATAVDEVDKLTNALMVAHSNWTAAFHCDTHQPPDVYHVVGEWLNHSELHFCRAVDPAVGASAFRTVCFDQPIDDCPRLTCPQLADRTPN